MQVSGTNDEVAIRTIDVLSEPAQFLIRRLSDELAEMYDTSPEDAERYIREIKPVEHGVFAAAFAGDSPIGCGMIRPYQEDDEIAEVKRVYVESAWRNRGVARKIMLALEAEARSLSFRKTLLETGVIQTAAIRLYESLGYRRRPCYGRYADDPLSVCFEKTLGD